MMVMCQEGVSPVRYTHFIHDPSAYNGCTNIAWTQDEYVVGFYFLKKLW